MRAVAALRKWQPPEGAVLQAVALRPSVHPTVYQRNKPRNILESGRARATGPRGSRWACRRRYRAKMKKWARETFLWSDVAKQACAALPHARGGGGKPRRASTRTALALPCVIRSAFAIAAGASVFCSGRGHSLRRSRPRMSTPEGGSDYTPCSGPGQGLLSNAAQELSEQGEAKPAASAPGLCRPLALVHTAGPTPRLHRYWAQSPFSKSLSRPQQPFENRQRRLFKSSWLVAVLAFSDEPTGLAPETRAPLRCPRHALMCTWICRPPPPPRCLK